MTLWTVTHLKRGTKYRVIGNATLQCGSNYAEVHDDLHESLDSQQWRLYQSVDDGSYHVRPQSEFDDGRFAKAEFDLRYAGWGEKALLARIAELERAINTPHTDEFFLAVRMEAAHQIERWGSIHDEGKSPTDWLFLVGHLASKASTYLVLSGMDEPSMFWQEYNDKGKHHIISSAAALLNWWRAVTGDTNAMRPGTEEPK